jgi:acid phosphatase class B
LDIIKKILIVLVLIPSLFLAQTSIRLSNYATLESYGAKTKKRKFATLKAQKIENNKIKVYFNNSDSDLIVKGNEIEGLEIAGTDEVFYAATGKIQVKTNSLC